MSDIKDDILFVGSGLDSDSAPQYTAKGDAPYRLHISASEDGLAGILTNMRGNHVATYHDLILSHAYQVVMSYYNPLTRKVYYYVFSAPYDSTGSGDYLYDNKLLEFDEDTEVISLIFLDEKNYFGLDLAHPVKDCDMIGDYLYFNPRISEPKMIDVVRAKNYTDYDPWDETVDYSSGDKVRFFGGLFVANTAVNAGESPSTHPAKWDRIGDCYQSETDLSVVWDSEFRYAFNVLKQIPPHRPTIEYGTDTNKHANNVRGKLFQFAYRFRYFDDTHSKFSAYSDNALPINEEKYNGEITEALDTYNYIEVSLSMHSSALIKEIDVAFRELGGDWKLAKTINRQEQGMLDYVIYNYKFYNTDPWYTVLPETLFEIQDSVPRWAATQELINKNILAYGGVTEGFDNVDKDEIDVTLTPEIEAIGAFADYTLIRDNRAIYGTITGDYPPAGDWDVFYSYTTAPYINTWVTMLQDWEGIHDPILFVAGDKFEVKFEGYETAIYTFPDTTGWSKTDLWSAIATFISTTFPEFEDVVSYADGIGIRGMLFVTKSIFYRPAASNANIAKHRGFKTGAWHPFCIFYYDRAMRRGDAQTSKELIEGAGYAIDGTNVYIPMLNEVSPPPLTTAYRWIVNWEVNHLPPTWAKWWRFGYAGNSLCSDFWQYTVEKIVDDVARNWTGLDITPLQTIKNAEAGWNQFPQSIIDPWEWVAGDRVRIITQASAATELGAVVEGVYDFEILKYDNTTVEGEYWIYTQLFDFASLGAGVDTLIEIYRPSKEETQPYFYEIGDVMPIIEDSDGNLVHGVTTTSEGTQSQDYALSLPATGIFYAGDVYHILRTPSKPIDGYQGWFHESRWYSDFYKSDTWDKGREGREANYGERTLNIVRFSNQLLQNTRINGLSTFGALDYKELNDIFGNIVGMVEVGNTLKVYMEKKSASILIGRQEYQDVNGQLTTANSTAVLGSVRYPENNFGAQWIESLSKNNRYVYGFDVYNAVVWRDSANGLFPISGRFDDPVGGSGNYRMATWFKQKSDALMLSGIENVQVMMVWDERYKNLFVIFKDNANSDNDDVVVFHEPSNRWITFAEFWYTPSEGWNQMLELTYDVVRGFDLGIGFEFDEDTRFAIFDIETANKLTFGADLAGITLTAYDLAGVKVDEAPALSLGDIALTAYDCTVYASYVALTDSDLSWIWSESGVSDAQPSTITSDSEIQITAMSMDYFTILNGSGNPLSLYDYVSSGEVLQFYPKSQNSSPSSRGGSVTFSNAYGNSVTITLTQTGYVSAPIVDLEEGNAPTMTITEPTPPSAVSWAVDGNPSVYLKFTPYATAHDPHYSFQVYWEANINGVSAGTGNFTARDEEYTERTITLTDNIYDGDTVTVYLYADGII